MSSFEQRRLRTAFVAPQMIIEKPQKSSVTFFAQVRAFFNSTVRLANVLTKVAENYRTDAVKEERVGGNMDAAEAYKKAGQTFLEAYATDSRPKLLEQARACLNKAIEHYQKRLDRFELKVETQVRIYKEMTKCYTALGDMLSARKCAVRIRELEMGNALSEIPIQKLQRVA